MMIDEITQRAREQSDKTLKMAEDLALKVYNNPTREDVLILQQAISIGFTAGVAKALEQKPLGL